ncbi:MAG: hypothetical protein EOP53_03810 [Sphingobacteriales bacterium]|nr:MAG: hypothetical protein EOP53_03810 [Sphingobacteriales bacterium]
MISDDSLQKLADKFAEKINQVTGIYIDTDDIKVLPKRKELYIKAWDCNLARIRYQSLNPTTLEQQIAEKVLTNPKQLRTKIIKCKVYHLTQYVPHWEKDIKHSLLQQNISTTFVDSLEFRIIDFGYRYKQFTPVEEPHYDYPYIAIKIHNQRDFDFSFPINVYDVVDPIDIEYLKHNLFIAILEKTLPSGKDLQEL